MKAVAVAGFSLLLLVLVLWALLPAPPPVICNYAGTGYLDPEIPDECEVGQPPPP
jgi:hypothetical protein